MPGSRHELRLPGGVVMAFRWIPSGEFRMGSRGQGENEEPIHRVRIERGFWLGETPVTQRQYGVWRPDHENGFPGHPQHPAERVSWRDAVEYCGWLREQSAEGVAGSPEGIGLARLPTEAEWEWACRAESKTEYWNGDGEEALREVGWYDENSGSETHSVGSKRANSWGLHDVHGNVWEWCHDSWEKLGYRGVVDGDADPGWERREREYAGGVEAMLKSDRYRVLRGGSWLHRAGRCRSACRYGRRPVVRNWLIGFRVCLVPGLEASGEGGARESAGAAAEGRTGDGAPSHEAAKSQVGPGARTDADAWRQAKLPPRQHGRAGGT